jgi:ribosomal protein L11 methyltransferase
VTSSADRHDGRWVELSVAVDVEAVEAVSEILGRETAGTSVQPARLIRDPNDELHARPDLVAEHVVTAHVPDDERAAAIVDRTERALWHLQAFGLRHVGPLRTRTVDASDWTDGWKAHYVPQRVGRVVIVPSWVDEAVEPDEVPVVMDPGMAFGTGLHPTTRGCLTLLQELSPMPARLLDVGCGSGILALAALALGADQAVACDTDPLAVTATLENAARNGVGDRMTAWEGTLPAQAAERFPLVLANLVAAVLVDLAPRLAGHLADEGVLLASGIIAPRGAEVVDAMTAVGLAVVERRDDGEWVSLRLEHRS